MDRDKVFVHVCGQMKCVFDDCQKKVGQRISHHLLRGGEAMQPGGIKKKMRKRKHGESEKNIGNGKRR